jgi:uncharacterized protein YeaO (DUF488 family)
VGTAPPRHPDVAAGRVYDPDLPAGRYRALVDRLWPRGMSKDAAGLDEWAKDVAPSTELRRWYGHDPQRFEAFRGRYLAELAVPPQAAAVARLRQLAAERPVLLLTATRDVERSAAQVLAEHLRADER